jgi:hypothetical protein
MKTDVVVAIDYNVVFKIIPIKNLALLSVQMFN